jgi:hypothetical protein
MKRQKKRATSAPTGDVLSRLEAVHYKTERIAALAATVDEASESTTLDVSPEGRRFRMLLDLLVEQCNALAQIVSDEVSLRHKRRSWPVGLREPPRPE